MKKSTYQKVRILLISTTVTMALAVPGSFLAMPHLLRWKYLSQLTSSNLHLREQGLSYVIMKAADDPLVRDGAFAKLAVVDGDNFTQIQNALDNAGLWKRPIVPASLWLRWCVRLGNQTDPKGRILGAQMGAELADDASDPKLHEFLTALLDDSNADVRYNALTTAASLGGDSSQPQLFLPELNLASKDLNPVVAREAWIFLGIFGLATMPEDSSTAVEKGNAAAPTTATSQPAPYPPTPWRKVPPHVGEAMIWALIKSQPHRALPITDVLANTSADPGLRAMAAYSLHMIKPPFFQYPLYEGEWPYGAYGVFPEIDGIRVDFNQTLKDGLRSDSNKAQVQIAWRILLSLPFLAHDFNDSESILNDHGRAQIEAVLARSPMSLSLLPLATPLAFVRSRMGMTDAQPPLTALEQLAQAEGMSLPAGNTPNSNLISARATLVVDRDGPDMLRLAAIQAALNPNPDDLYALFSSTESTMRDLAVHVAAMRFTPAQNSALIRKALTDFNDHAKMSGAILSGLTGLESEFLEKKLSESRIWEVEQMMQVGLWMQGKLPRFAQKAADLLTRADLPTSTLLVAQLHQGHTLALDVILNPQGEPTMDLVDLFDPKRWSKVLWLYLPDDAPPFWVWADPELERFQIDVLRNWYLVHRKTLKLPGGAKITASR